MIKYLELHHNKFLLSRLENQNGFQTLKNELNKTSF